MAGHHPHGPQQWRIMGLKALNLWDLMDGIQGMGADRWGSTDGSRRAPPGTFCKHCSVFY